MFCERWTKGKRDNMKIDELLKELDDIIDSASSVPLTNKVMVEKEEILAILEDIERALPDEIKQARWIQNEKDRILSEAKKEYQTVVNDAKRHAESLVEKNEIVTRARKRADEFMMVTENNVRKLKMGTYDYVDKVLYNMQNQLEEMKNLYEEMFKHVGDSFEKIEQVIAANRDEIKEMAYNTQMDKDGVSID